MSARIKEELKNQVANLKAEGKSVGLAVMIVGNNSASRVYVDNKKKACAEIGIYSEEYALPEETTQEEILEIIDMLNKKDDIDGILVQLPLPKHIDEKAVINAIDPKKTLMLSTL